MPVSAEDIRRWILKEIARPEAEASDILVEAVRLRGYSRIFKARLPGIANAVAIKLCLDPDDWQPSAMEAASQYSALSQAWQASGHSRKFLALKPYPLLRERGCVVMNWAGGRTMSDGWLWRGRSSAKMIEDAAAAGRWLKAFHDSGVTGYGTLDLQDMLAYLSEKVERANSRFKELPVVTNACAALSRTAGAGAAGGEFPVTWLHGDFKAANVLFVGEQEQPVGIDLQLGPGEIGLHDIVNFIVNLDLVSLEPGSLRLLQCREAVVRGFVTGYFGSSERVPASTLLWMRLHVALMIWAAREDAPKRDARSRFLRARLRLVAQRLLRELLAGERDNPPGGG